MCSYMSLFDSWCSKCGEKASTKIICARILNVIERGEKGCVGLCIHEK